MLAREYRGPALSIRGDPVNLTVGRLNAKLDPFEWLIILINKLKVLVVGWGLRLRVRRGGVRIVG